MEEEKYEMEEEGVTRSRLVFSPCRQKLRFTTSGFLQPLRKGQLPSVSRVTSATWRGRGGGGGGRRGGG